LIETRRLGPELLGAYLDFFDRRAFPDNADWSGCYCNFLHADCSARRWEAWTAEENRSAVVARIQAGRMPGLLAFAGDVPVGWCGAGPMTGFRALADEPREDRDRLGYVTCFVVAPDWRRRGVARTLLRAACDAFRADGLTIAEANPRPRAESDADNHYGPLGLYLSEGFEIWREDPSDGSVFVRKALS
jgi:GNAT superfamily N-acetyltransferase